MAAQGASGTDFYDRSILRPKHRAYYRSGSTVIKIGPKGALGSHEIRPMHSAPSLGQSIGCRESHCDVCLWNFLILCITPRRGRNVGWDEGVMYSDSHQKIKSSSAIIVNIIYGVRRTHKDLSNPNDMHLLCTVYTT